MTDLLAFWLPLALSWAMMAAAQPLVTAGIGRLPDAPVHLAAYGVTLDLAVLMESPIIMMFSASVALARDQESYRLLRQFMLGVSGVLTAVFAAVTFTPLGQWALIHIVGVPSDVADPAAHALVWLLPWVPAIAWRRFHQGPLLTAGRPRLISYGTAGRLLALTAVVGAGTRWPVLPGTSLGAVALSTSVVVEALLATWWARPLVRRLPSGGSPGLTLRSVWGFYLPLAATDLMRVISRPVTTAGIARAAAAGPSLSAWPVSHGLVMLVCSGVMAFQEMVVALAGAAPPERRVERFVMVTGAVFTVALAILAATPALSDYLTAVVRLPPDLRPLAIAGVRWMVPLPLLLAVRNLLRGILIHRRRTPWVQHAMTAYLVTLAGGLAMGVWGGMTGVVLAAASTVAAQVVEVGVLAVALSLARGLPVGTPASTANVYSSPIPGGRRMP
ncbi:MAG: hypothetical protein QN194_15625 [Armatimonadota bacterium]|nr:hypothetical protein [Armatimonadota bacterium]MDR7574343.1 hypothetical protein [Armatimonadota bacterium]